MSTHRFSYKTLKNPKKLPTVCIVRYGAIGDTIQAASVCAAYKKLGYHVTLMCSYPGSELVALDPNIDQLLVQMTSQIPQQWLGFYWVWMSKKWRIDDTKGFDKWVNLCESVESTLLAVEGNIKFEWPAAMRERVMNDNYLEFQHAIAGVPYEPTYKFHPQPEEVKWRDEERARMRKAGIERFILWNLAGSSRTHKLYPHQLSIWQHVLKYFPKWGVVTVGDGSCADLEEGDKGERRLWRTSGKWNIRQVLTMMEVSDVVFGPETGVMSAAAFYPMPKILLLTHSTTNNLSRDWVNTTSIWAPSTWCPGRGKNEAKACHMMHSKFEPGCRRNEEFGVAQCTVEIKPEWVWDHLQRAMTLGEGGTWFPPAANSPAALSPG
jgi:ADP-heptose:LPS heptosyltransferase